MLCRWAGWFGASGIGVDLSEVFTAAARARTRELGVEERVEIVLGEAAAYARQAAERATTSFDVVACLGATWIGGGLAGTIGLMRPLVRPDGFVVIGEPFIEEPLPPEGFAALGFGPDDYVSLERTMDRFSAAGLDVVEMTAADARGWERYEAAQWLAVSRWLDANSADPDAGHMRDFMETGRRNYAAWGRRHLGWAVFVARPKSPAR